MAISYENLKEELKNRNIRLSHQRLKILEFIANNRIHPTVDNIYNALHKEIPTLSKTTVYNTLKTLVDADLVKIVNIEENEARYDIDTDSHGHFKCESCGDVFDFDIDIDSFISDELVGFKINHRDVYFKGICNNCQV